MHVTTSAIWDTLGHTAIVGQPRNLRTGYGTVLDTAVSVTVIPGCETRMLWLS